MANDVLNALLTRRSLKPKYLTLPFPTKDQIETAARAALRAPVHGDDFPCRFVVIPDIKRDKLAELFRSAAATCIIPMQDWLGLDNSAWE